MDRMQLNGIDRRYRVEVIGIGFGTVINTRIDSNGVPMYTVELDDKTGATDLYHIARREEIRRPLDPAKG